MPVSTLDYSVLGVLRLLATSPSSSQREIARELGMSLGKANYVIQALLDKGFVKVRNFGSSRNKRAYVYLLTPAGITARTQLTRRFLARKLEEFDALQLEIEQLRIENESPWAEAAGQTAEGRSRT